MSISPGEWLGLLGGGQLGRMFCMAAQSMGFRVCVLDPGDHSPAGAVADDHIRADYLDESALIEIAQRCRAVTTEFENVPAAAMRRLADHCVVRPAADSVAVAQDRIHEKRFMVGHGIAVGPHIVVQRIDDLDAAPLDLFPGILKTARLGYDGKGQASVSSRDDAIDAWSRGGRVPCVLEKRLQLHQEVSCIVCRDADGAMATFPVVENAHRGGILAVSVAPARVTAEVADRARDTARKIAENLGYVGVLCVEFFVLEDGRVLVNEIAPRPHNSGHLTIDACVTSQFEQQARILAGLPLGATTQLAPAVMLNILGDIWFADGARREPPWRDVLRIDGAKLHLYGKRDARPGRKMGHVTIVGQSVPEALARAAEVASVLGIDPPR
ncbi:MAG: 5-(carboxyamino)imidazole ribonucleotide synthase [Gemmatimonadota bacterium]